MYIFMISFDKFPSWAERWILFLACVSENAASELIEFEASKTINLDM